MSKRSLLLFLGAAVASLLAGCCATPMARAHHHPEKFRKLAPADQQLVLHGSVRPGMSKDAVYIAWGEPDEKRPSGSAKEGGETWLYEREIAVKAAMGSFDQWEPSAAFWGLNTPLGLQPGAGFGGIGNEGMLLYQPHLLVTDETVKRAVFSDNKLEKYDLRQGGFTVAP